MGSAAAQSNNGAMRKDHAQLVTSLIKRKKNALVYSYTNGFSGFSARLTEEEARSIAQEPGVVSVFPDPILQLHTTRSWDFLHSFSDKKISSTTLRPGLARAQPSSSGEADIIIGIMDTGIWPESASFNDDGMRPIPSRWKGKCEEGDHFNSSKCNRKLIGARYYDSSSARDDSGHGTHVSSTAAGSLVDDASYYGVANGTAKGGSPSSRIAMYKVCVSSECSGSAMLKGFDDAIKDGVDVLSVSLGDPSRIKPDYTTDPIALGAFHAVEKGIVVVCSAGNTGPTPSSVGNEAPWIFTVAASTIDRDFQSQILLGDRTVIKGGGIHFGNLTKTPVHPLVTAVSVKLDNATGSNASEIGITMTDEGGVCFRDCLPQSLDPVKAKGKIILCEPHNPIYDYDNRKDEVKSAGGIGIILIVTEEARFTAPKFDIFPGSIIIKKEGNQISNYINSTRNPVATILPTVTITGNKPAPVVISFSGRGPSLASTNLLKPDICAPGVDILAAWPTDPVLNRAIPGKNPPGYYIISGTSMACPHTSGIVAAIKAQNPKFSPSAIRSAIMTTAIQTNNQNAPITTSSGPNATPYDIGAGEANPTASIEPGLVYETETADYALFLCATGYNTSQIKLISKTIPKDFQCPDKLTEDAVSSMNYPSIAISKLKDGEPKTVTRTATNVGPEESVYTATIEAMTGIEATVTPNKLVFTKEKKKLSYKVTFTAPSSLKNDTFGSITWTSECKTTPLTQQIDGVYIVYMGAVAPSNNGAMREDQAQLVTALIKRKKNALLYTYTNGFSGFSARLTEEDARSIAQEPGVVSVFPDPILQLHTTRSWDFLHSFSDKKIFAATVRPKSTRAKPSSSGEADIIIGIMDSGIWPESASFNDDGIGPIPSRWKGKCVEGDNFNSSNCNRKLIGARYYESSSARDYSGHGTHVSSTAAGSLVDDASYSGLAKGTAKGGSPSSRIAMYRVCQSFECSGSAILKGFDDAIKDGVDVLSVSLGDPSGIKPDFTTNAIALGAFHAVEKGIVVVCSAGNSGPTPSSVVNEAPWIFTVAASTIDRDFQSQVVLGDKTVIKGGGIHFGNLTKTSLRPLATGASVKLDNNATGSDDARECAPQSLDPAKVKGKIILCETHNPSYDNDIRMNEVKSVGGVGIILIVTEQERNPVATILPTETIIGNKQAPVVISFSARGPCLTSTNLLKPDICAPGVDILAAWPTDPDLNQPFPGKNPPGYNIISGTSMACPHISGIVAAVKARNPKFSASAIRSAIMTTAIQTNNQNAPITTSSGPNATPYDIGAGEANPTIEPGLVYETETADYALFLCATGYNTSQIKLISKTIPKDFQCPDNLTEDIVSSINYPSIAISKLKDGEPKTVTRTATNVGPEESVYTATIEAMTGIEATVTPNKLVFTKEKKKLTYKVTFTTSSSPKNDIFGSITWRSDKYRVRSPIVVSIE
nr:subtilisin-like protease SBT5.3 [Ipomoea batatas]